MENTVISGVRSYWCTLAGETRMASNEVLKEGFLVKKVSKNAPFPRIQYTYVV